MVLELYATASSGPCRMAMMALDFLGLDYNFKEVNLMKAEQLKPEYIKLNPQHALPTLTDGDFVISESRAVVCYIADAHGKDSDLYPDCPKIRGKIHQRLFFEMGTYYQAFAGGCAYPVARHQIDHVPADKLAELKKVLEWTSDMMKKTGFFAETEKISVADLALLANFSALIECGFYPNVLEDFPLLKEWFHRCKALIPNYEKSNGEGARSFGLWFKSGLAK